jgi:hypothetical protein
MSTKDAVEEAKKHIPGLKPAVGIDVGTYTLVVAGRDKQGDFEFREEVNGFFEIRLTPETRMFYGMVKQSGAPIYEIPDRNVAYVLGKSAREQAFAWSSVLGGRSSDSEIFQRTMKDGILSTRDSNESFNVLKMMVGGLVNPYLSGDRTPVCFSHPGPALDRGDLDPEYHKRTIGQMLQKVGKVRPDAYGFNEAMAIVEAELGEEGYTGLAISCGAGMTNVAFSVMGMPIFTFSIVGGGDWIDRSAAHASGTEPVIVNQVKMGEVDEDGKGLDLTKPPGGENAHIERALHTHYDILIDKIVQGIEKFVREKQAKVMAAKKPSVVVAGGTASPNGFIERLREKLVATDLGSFKIGEVRKADNNLYTVAKGLLLNAERMQRQ